MTLPPNIRVNVGAPFPARVQGSGPITVSKANGVWTVSLNISGIASQVPLLANFATDYVLFYDSIANAFFKMSISALVAAVTPPAGARTQRSVTVSPIIVVGNDSILNVNINAGAPTCALPAAATRAGAPLTFVDVGLRAAAHNITLTPNGAETILNAQNPAAYTMSANGDAVTLVPFNDGTNTGWTIQ
jgi:hypothetical protein